MSPTIVVGARCRASRACRAPARRSSPASGVLRDVVGDVVRRLVAEHEGDLVGVLGQRATSCIVMRPPGGRPRPRVWKAFGPIRGSSISRNTKSQRRGGAPGRASRHIGSAVRSIRDGGAGGSRRGGRQSAGAGFGPGTPGRRDRLAGMVGHATRQQGSEGKGRQGFDHLARPAATVAAVSVRRRALSSDAAKIYGAVQRGGSGKLNRGAEW